MARLRALIDDTEVTLAFYGSIVYLAEVSALGSRQHPAAPIAGVSTVVATATVLFIAHVFASLVPDVAHTGRLRWGNLGRALRHDSPLLVTALVPAIPLLLAASDVIEVGSAYRLSVRLTIAMLFVVAVWLSRRDGLSWGRAVIAGLAIIGVTVVVIWLESHLH